jgi:hypothetical protein
MSSTTTQYPDVTPYHFAQVATAILREAGILDETEEITGPGMYGNKQIKRVEGCKSRRDGGDGIVFDGDSAHEWLERRLAGGGTGARSRVNVPKLVEAFSRSAEDEQDEATDTAVTDNSDDHELEEVLQASIDAQVAAEEDESEEDESEDDDDESEEDGESE